MIPILTMWLFSTLSLSITTTAQSTTSKARALDSLLQNYAYEAFLRPKTGVVYDSVVPSNLTGIQISAMRLRSGSLKSRGFSKYKEFQIPKGVSGHPYIKRLVLLYHNLGNWSNTYYPLENYTYLAPVLGLLAYDASNLTAKNLPELDIQASDQPIRIQFPELGKTQNGTFAKCVSFDKTGSINFSHVVSDNICTTFQPGHFSVVVESVAPSFPPANATKRGPIHGGNSEKFRWKARMVVGIIVGLFIGLFVLGFLVVSARKYTYRKKMCDMERAADIGDILNMINIGSTRAPAATGTRTHPKLETEYVP